MKLIADSGSTSTNWVLIENDGTQKKFNTEGYNPFFIKSDGIVKSLSAQLLSHLNADAVSEIHFYGSGVSNAENVKTIDDAFRICFPNAKNFIEHDLLSSCRALLGRERGFAAILGTGTNTAIYDGEKVEMNIDSLGYALGDEGSGSYIGRLLLRSYLRDFMPQELAESFRKKFLVTEKNEILRNIYDQPLPNRFLASYASFIEGQSHPFISDLIHLAFHDFFENIVSHYPRYTEYTFNCVGSIAFHQQEILKQVSSEFGMRTGKIIQSPIDELVKFHLMEK
ncbi:MAG TPA: N-acetylglucosamine kinase [Bacteroidetes bacterium]|nr:N-acetylglucosamine kinase [Bacteroidota bacterium]